jgi:hypothetical protein
MKIAEMEAHHNAYADLEKRIATMVADRDFPEVFVACEESFQHIVPASQFRKKRGIRPEVPRLLSFTVTCKYAPAVFEHAAIESLLDFVRSTRLLARHENGYLRSVEAALAREEVARLLWNHLEREPGFLQRDIGNTLGLSQEAAVAVLEIWEELGLVARRSHEGSYALHLRGGLDSTATGMCHSCGVTGTARKELFLRPISCKRCGTEGYYLIVDSDCE